MLLALRLTFTPLDSSNPQYVPRPRLGPREEEQTSRDAPEHNLLERDAHALAQEEEDEHPHPLHLLYLRPGEHELGLASPRPEERATLVVKA